MLYPLSRTVSPCSIKNPGNEAVRHRVEHLLDSWVDTESYGCEQIFNKQQMKGLHLAGPFDYVIEGRLGTSFGNSCTGQLICPIDNSDYKLSVSAHGHLPIKGPQPIFLRPGRTSGKMWWWSGETLLMRLPPMRLYWEWRCPGHRERQ